MSKKDLLDNIKKLREMTGVGFKDCKVALDETKGDIDKSIEFFQHKKKQILGIMWHPERYKKFKELDKRIFKMILWS